MTKRLAGDTGYLETMERDNVELVDLRAEPIQTFTPNGIIVGDREIALDIIVFATGFDFGTGAMAQLDIRGRDGRCLREAWSDGVCTYLGLMAPKFPNLFWISGPGCPFYNPMLLAQYQFAQIERFVDQHAESGEPVEATEAAAAEWTELHNSIGNSTLFTKGDNYFIGGNIKRGAAVSGRLSGVLRALRQSRTYAGAICQGHQNRRRIAGKLTGQRGPTP